MSTSFAIQLVASASTIAASWAYGNKSIVGPLLGLASQVPWWALMAVNGLWGLLPVNVVMTVIHARNAVKWWREG